MLQNQQENHEENVLTSAPLTTEERQENVAARSLQPPEKIRTGWIFKARKMLSHRQLEEETAETLPEPKETTGEIALRVGNTAAKHFSSLFLLFNIGSLIKLAALFGGGLIHGSLDIQRLLQMTLKLVSVSNAVNILSSWLFWMLLLASLLLWPRFILSIARSDDKDWAGTLLGALKHDDRKVRRAAERGLTRILPKLTAEDVNTLDEDARAALYDALNRSDPLLVYAVLQAIQQLGDVDATPYVEPLARGEGVAATHPQVAEMAQQCLFALQGRILLRPSSAMNLTPETLLRPAAFAPASDPATLLRAATPDITEESQRA